MEILAQGNGRDSCEDGASPTSSTNSNASSLFADSSFGSVTVDSLPKWEHLKLGLKFRILKRTDQIEELQTSLRDASTSRSDFKFVADRLIRMVIEEGLNQLRK